MKVVSMWEAKASLLKLVDALATGYEREVVLVHKGHPVAKLVPVDTPKPGQRIGVAKGKLAVPDDIDAHNNETALLFFNETANQNAGFEPTKK